MINKKVFGKKRPNNTVPDAEGFYSDGRELGVQVCEVDEAIGEDRLLALSWSCQMNLVSSGVVPEVQEGGVMCWISDAGGPSRLTFYASHSALIPRGFPCPLASGWIWLGH